jgi:hypothetical protein
LARSTVPCRRTRAPSMSISMMPATLVVRHHRLLQGRHRGGRHLHRHQHRLRGAVAVHAARAQAFATPAEQHVRVDAVVQRDPRYRGVGLQATVDKVVLEGRRVPAARGRGLCVLRWHRVHLLRYVHTIPWRARSAIVLIQWFAFQRAFAARLRPLAIPMDDSSAVDRCRSSRAFSSSPTFRYASTCKSKEQRRNSMSANDRKALPPCASGAPQKDGVLRGPRG